MTTLADGSYLGRMLALVGGRDTVGALAEGAERVTAAVRRAGASGLERPWAPGKWTGRQVVAHLADAEMGIGFRVRQVMSHVMNALRRESGHVPLHQREQCLSGEDFAV